MFVVQILHYKVFLYSFLTLALSRESLTPNRTTCVQIYSLRPILIDTYFFLGRPKKNEPPITLTIFEHYFSLLHPLLLPLSLFYNINTITPTTFLHYLKSIIKILMDSITLPTFQPFYYVFLNLSENQSS